MRVAKERLSNCFGSLHIKIFLGTRLRIYWRRKQPLMAISLILEFHLRNLHFQARESLGSQFLAYLKESARDTG